MGRKLGALHPFWGEEVCSHLTEVAWAEAYLHTKWHLNPSNHLATMNMGRKVWECPFGEGELGQSCGVHGEQTGQTGRRSHSRGRTVLQTVAHK